MNEVYYLGKYFTTFVVGKYAMQLHIKEDNLKFCNYMGRACIIREIIKDTYVLQLITNDQEDCIEIKYYGE